jgi:hypothetical protein
MRTLNLQEAAALLHMNPEHLRRKAVSGEIPGAKPGKCWVFLDEDLAEYLRGLYAHHRQTPQVEHEVNKSWHSTNAAKPALGGLDSQGQTVVSYDTLVKRQTASSRSSTKRS